MTTLTSAHFDLPANLDYRVVVTSVCKSSFWQFVRKFWECVPGAGALVESWHMKVFADELQKAAERVFDNLPKENNLICNVSPGTSKSTIWSILFPAWVWTRMPHARFICASHTLDLVLDLSHKAREVIRSDLYRSCFPHVILQGDQDAKGNYANTAGGSRLSCTVGGKTPTGFHGHFLIIDDPLDPQKAVSEAELRVASDFVTNVISTRKVDKAISVICLVMQRLHIRDPTAALLEASRRDGAVPVRHICLPAELPPEDRNNVLPPELRSMYIDGLMDPVRLNRQVLREAYANLQEYAYSGQFRQLPIVIGGGMFKAEYFNGRVKASPYKGMRIRYWDRACLVAGTQICTKLGDKLIESVVAGDLVLTRNGYRPVVWSGMSKLVDEVVSVLFSDGSVVTGTADHRIWTENRGWIDLASVRGSDYCLVTQKGGVSWRKNRASGHRRESSSMVLSTLGNREDTILKRIDGIRRKGDTGRIHCTELCGGFITVTYPLAVISTTRTKIGITTTSKILSVYPELNITGSTELLPDGIKRRKLKNTINESSRKSGRMLSTESTFVLTARRSSRRAGSTHHQSFARLSAEIGSVSASSPRIVPSVIRSFGDDPAPCAAQTPVPMCSGLRCVRCAMRSLKRNNERRFAAAEAVGPDGNGCIPVYDLEVEGTHEFFANGILVHNSTLDGGCYTAGVLMSRDDEGLFYVEHVIHGQWEPVERNRKIKAAAQRDRARYGPNNEPTIYIEREGGSSGRDAWGDISRLLAGFRVKEDTVTGAKDSRAEPWSCQLAAGNVKIVDNGESDGTGKAEWDVQGYVEEHLLFRPEPGKRLGRYKDQVDASSGAFNLLAGSKKVGPLRVYSFGTQKRAGLRIVICSPDKLGEAVIELPAVLLHLIPPRTEMVTPDHALTKLQDSTQIAVADLDPRDYQETWNEPILAYNATPAEVIMDRDGGRIIWNFIRKKREPQPQIIVLVDESSPELRVGETIALCLCDLMGLGRDLIYKIDDEDWVADDDTKVPNQHVYDVLKASRALVM